jgi:indolepyruvate ferredoxin oxidoreductase
LLSKFKGLRGTAFDIFGYTDERRMERQLVADYEKTLGVLLGSLSSSNYDQAVDIASIPEHIRGFGHVKHQHVSDARKREAELLEKFSNPVAGAPREIRVKVAA